MFGRTPLKKTQSSLHSRVKDTPRDNEEMLSMDQSIAELQAHVKSLQGLFDDNGCTRRSRSIPLISLKLES